MLKTPILTPRRGQKGVKMNFWGKSENVMFLHSLRLSFMPKIRKIYRAVLRENLVRETERQTDRETETDPNIRVLWTLSLSRRTKKQHSKIDLDTSQQQ